MAEKKQGATASETKATEKTKEKKVAETAAPQTAKPAKKDTKMQK